MTRSHIAWVMVAALVFGGCEDATEPGGIAGTYDLVEANGQPLPAVVFDGETSAGHLVATALSGTLTLRSSTYTERVVFNIRLDDADFGSGPVTLTGEYEASGALLEFDPDREDLPAFTGSLSGGVLTMVEPNPDFGELTLVWER